MQRLQTEAVHPLLKYSIYQENDSVWKLGRRQIDAHKVNNYVNGLLHF